MQLRLQKYLAEHGVGSRRKCEEYIAQGLVKVNGKIVTEMGIKVDPDVDLVVFDKRKIAFQKAKFVYLMVNKPRGFETTLKSSLPNARTVKDLVEGFRGHLVPVGRLDKNSEGMLIMTDDGQLVHNLTHPSKEHEKEYQVMVEGMVDNDVLEKLRKGVVIEGRKTLPCEVKKNRAGEKSGRTLLDFVLKQGRRRQIRLMCEAVGLWVKRLKRVRIGALEMKGLRPGGVRELTAKEVALLKKSLL